MTLTGANLVAMAACSAIGGALNQPLILVLAFTAINLMAATIAGRSDRLTGPRR